MRKKKYLQEKIKIFDQIKELCQNMKTAPHDGL